MSITSLLRTFGSVTGLLSPHGDKVAGNLTEDTIVVTPALALPTNSTFPPKSFAQWLFTSPSSVIGVAPVEPGWATDMKNSMDLMSIQYKWFVR